MAAEVEVHTPVSVAVVHPRAGPVVTSDGERNNTGYAEERRNHSPTRPSAGPPA